MKLDRFLVIFLLSFSFQVALAQQGKDAVVTGHVVSKGEHIPFVNIYIENTSIGTTTDITGHYILVDPPIGKHTIVAKMIGYKTQKKEIELAADQTLEIKFDLEEDFIKVDEVVITGTKTFKRQTESAVIV